MSCDQCARRKEERIKRLVEECNVFLRHIDGAALISPLILEDHTRETRIAFEELKK